MLIKCPECGKDVSSSARCCPHCGFQISPPVVLSWVKSLFVCSRIVGLILICVGVLAPVLIYQSEEFEDTSIQFLTIVILVHVFPVGLLLIFDHWKKWALALLAGLILCSGLWCVYGMCFEFSKDRAVEGLFVVMVIMWLFMVALNIAFVTYKFHRENLRPELKRVARRRRGLLRAPLTVLIPSLVLVVMMMVLAMIVTYVCATELRNENPLVTMAIVWIMGLVFLWLNIGLVKGDSYPRTWFTIAIVFRVITVFSDPGKLIGSLMLAIPWCLSLYSPSARRWFKAHERIAKLKRLRKQIKEA